MGGAYCRVAAYPGGCDVAGGTWPSQGCGLTKGGVVSPGGGVSPQCGCGLRPGEKLEPGGGGGASPALRRHPRGAGGSWCSPSPFDWLWGSPAHVTEGGASSATPPRGQRGRGFLAVAVLQNGRRLREGPRRLGTGSDVPLWTGLPVVEGAGEVGLPVGAGRGGTSCLGPGEAELPVLGAWRGGASCVGRKQCPGLPAQAGEEAGLPF